MLGGCWGIQWGIMVSPELSCVYSPYFKAANDTGIDLYIASWASYIKSLRNHPSIFDWPMCNEYAIHNYAVPA